MLVGHDDFGAGADDVQHYRDQRFPMDRGIGIPGEDKFFVPLDLPVDAVMAQVSARMVSLSGAAILPNSLPIFGKWLQRKANITKFLLG